MKIFITGIFNSGKTTLALEIAKALDLQYVSFDHAFNYHQMQSNDDSIILESLPENFVMDAIPFYADVKTYYDNFMKYYAKHNDIIIIMTYCSDMRQWIERYVKKFGKNVPACKFEEYAVYSKMTMYDLPFNINAYYDSSSDVVRDKAHHDDFLKKNEKHAMEMYEKLIALRAHIDGQSYDKYYQDIDVLNMKGYSDSAKTWLNIRDIIEWKNRSVFDMGCFHGYFTIKAAEMGAKAIGLDRSPEILHSARMIADASDAQCDFRLWTGGEETPVCDIGLCLNMLHHTADMRKTIAGMRCEYAIFEINETERAYVEERFNVISQVESHRQNRVILYCTKK